MKPKKAGVMLTVLLSGCFNTVHVGPGVIMSPGPTPEPIRSVPEVAEKQLIKIPVVIPPKVSDPIPAVDLTLLCPRFKFHTIPDTPALPVKELGTVDIHDARAVNRVLYKHIDELRAHVAKLKNRMTTDRKAYLSECNVFLEQNK